MRNERRRKRRIKGRRTMTNENEAKILIIYSRTTKRMTRTMENTKTRRHKETKYPSSPLRGFLQKIFQGIRQKLLGLLTKQNMSQPGKLKCRSVNNLKLQCTTQRSLPLIFLRPQGQQYDRLVEENLCHESPKHESETNKQTTNKQAMDFL